MDKYDAPTRYAETVLLCNCALLAIDTTMIRHKTDCLEAANELQKENRKIADRGIQTVAEIKTELNRIKSEMSEIAYDLTKRLEYR